jgi:hypothetical protein
MHYSQHQDTPGRRRHPLRSLARSRSGIRRELYWQARQRTHPAPTPAVAEVEYRDVSPLSMPQVITGRPWPEWAEVAWTLKRATVEG